MLGNCGAYTLHTCTFWSLINFSGGNKSDYESMSYSEDNGIQSASDEGIHVYTQLRMFIMWCHALFLDTEVEVDLDVIIDESSDSEDCPDAINSHQFPLIPHTESNLSNNSLSSEASSCIQYI